MAKCRIFIEPSVELQQHHRIVAADGHHGQAVHPHGQVSDTGSSRIRDQIHGSGPPWTSCGPSRPCSRSARQVSTTLVHWYRSTSFSCGWTNYGSQQQGCTVFKLKSSSQWWRWSPWPSTRHGGRSGVCSSRWSTQSSTTWSTTPWRQAAALKDTRLGMFITVTRAGSWTILK